MPGSIKIPALRTLFANRTYYVRTDGSDSNTGLVDSAGGAFLTIQKAIDTAEAFDLGGFSVNIIVATGTYDEHLTFSTQIATGGGGIFITGQSGVAANTIIKPTTNTFFPVVYCGSGPGSVTFQFVHIDASHASFGTNPPVKCEADFDFYFFGCLITAAASASTYIYEFYAGSLELRNNSYHCNGSHFAFVGGSGFDFSCPLFFSNETLLSGTPSFSSAFIELAGGATAYFLNSWPGWESTTGKRFFMSTHSRIRTFLTDSPTFFPGNAPGTADASCAYEGSFGSPTNVGSKESAALPTTAEVPIDSTWGVFRDASSTAAWVSLNDAGTMKHITFSTTPEAIGALTVDADGRTITVAESGTTFTNEGATAIAPFVLPGAAVGLNYSFMVQDADGIRVTAASGDTIRIAGAVSAAAGKIESTTIGSTVTIKAVNATEWIATTFNGTWTVT